MRIGLPDGNLIMDNEKNLWQSAKSVSSVCHKKNEDDNENENRLPDDNS